MPDTPDERVAKLKTPEECAVFAKNVTELGRPDLAIAARKRAVQLRAATYGATNEVEMECLEAIYAYEEVMSAKSGRRKIASRTWPMIKKYGVIGTVELVVKRKDETTGYTALVEMGMEDYAFEAVILRHPTFFSADAIMRSRERMEA